MLSLLIILVSGLFVGWCWGLQGYEILQRYGSTEAMGAGGPVAVRAELGPGGRRSALRQPRRLGHHRRIGLMKVTEQLRPWT